MKDYQTSQHLHANLADTDTNDCHLKQPCTGDMFQRKIDDEYLKTYQTFGIADDMLVVGYDSDGKDHDVTLLKVLQICWQVNLKLNKYKCHFSWTPVPLFGEVISSYGVKPDLQRFKEQMEMSPSKNKKWTPSIPWNNYLFKVNSLLSLKTSVNYYENWHQVNQSGPAMWHMKNWYGKNQSWKKMHVGNFMMKQSHYT